MNSYTNRIKSYIFSSVHSPTTRLLVSESFWSISGAMVLQGLTFVAYIVAARLVGQETFGEFGLVKSTAMTFSTYALFGMGITAAKYIPEWLQSEKQNVGQIIAFNYVFATVSGFFFALFFFLTTPWICDHVINAPYLVGPFRLATILLFLITVMGAQTGVLSGFHNFKAIATTSMVVGLVTVPLFALGAIYGGVYGLVIAMITTTIVNIMMNARFVTLDKRKHGIIYDLKMASILPVLWKFTAPAALQGFLGAPILWICYLILTAQSQGLTELAVLIVAMQIYHMATFVQSQTWRVFLARLSGAVGQQDKRKCRQIARLSLILNCLSSLLIVIPIILLSRVLLGLYGSDFVSGTYVLITLCFSSFAFSLLCIPLQIMNSQGKAWECLAIALCGNVLLIVVSIVLMRHGYGAWGIAIAHLLSNSLQCLLSFLYLLIFDPRSLF